MIAGLMVNPSEHENRIPRNILNGSSFNRSHVPSCSLRSSRSSFDRFGFQLSGQRITPFFKSAKPFVIDYLLNFFPLIINNNDNTEVKASILCKLTL